ncbi:Topoisomerase 1-related protein TRF4 [Giardia duodenalis]|uniref:Topoisomerase 1-related protein TRF4 n=1 Tax=Giardia intestinalis TaxID=5741 RepID=V6TUD7_GIAIN|nr:Topoisomerase 1-related protein TRF4 [Giardia intestinalis]
MKHLDHEVWIATHAKLQPSHQLTELPLDRTNADVVLPATAIERSIPPSGPVLGKVRSTRYPHLVTGGGVSSSCRGPTPLAGQKT